MNDGLGLRWAQLAATALVVGAVSWIGWRIYLGTGALLGPAPWISSVLLLALSVLVVGAGLPVRRFLCGEATKPLSPIRAARTLVLAQPAAAALLTFITAYYLLAVGAAVFGVLEIVDGLKPPRSWMIVVAGILQIALAFTFMLHPQAGSAITARIIGALAVAIGLVMIGRAVTNPAAQPGD